jgi:methylthioribose-1-phosphate isomerase
VRLVDQRRLPAELAFIEASTVDDLCSAINSLAIRGAPALGAAGAMGIALAAATGMPLEQAAQKLKDTRPTAINLAWGVDRALTATNPIAEALTIAAEDVARNRQIGAHGLRLLPDAPRVLTHCHTGALACVGYGTALGVIRAAHEDGRQPTVWASETRPVLQGARLTAWELHRLGIPVTVIVDGLAGSLLASGCVDCVIVGADRIAANGDVANKVGTYSLAVLADYHGVPFYVAAPLSSVDLVCPTGTAIPLERRSGDELALSGGQRIVPDGVPVENPAFDITPSRLIAALITERGVIERPAAASLARLAGQES